MATKKATAKVKATTARATTRDAGARVDSAEKEFEDLLRQMFVFRMHRWMKAALEAKAIDKMPSNDERKDVVDDLVAMWSCAIETTIDSAVDTFLSTTVDEDDEVADCPKCGAEMDLPEDFDSGEIECPSCQHVFDPDADDDPDPDGGEPMVIDAEIVVEESPRVSARRRA